MITLLFFVFTQLAIAQEIARDVRRDLEFAKICLPKFGEKEVKFCTGPSLSFKLVKEIERKGRDFCIKEIEKRNYKVFLEEGKKKISASGWSEFYNSTKWAQAYHDKKIVFFKKSVDHVDCLHELIQVIQWSFNGENPLAPKNRDLKFKAFKQYLFKKVDAIKSYEEKGNREKMEELSASLKPEFETFKEYSEIGTWLDEKDIYYFFLKNCNKIFACKPKDKTTFLAKLIQFKKFLPWRVRNEVLSIASKEVKRKEDGIVNDIIFKKLSRIQKAKLKQLSSASYEALVNFAKKENIKVSKIKLKKGLVDTTGMELISAKLLDSLPNPTKAELNSYVEYRKIDKNFIFGKYLCNKKTKSIIVTNYMSRIQFHHELVHHIQSKNNVFYCPSTFGQMELYKNFLSGKVPRDDYENELLRKKIFVRKIELEAYLLQETFFDNLKVKISRMIGQLRISEEKNEALPITPGKLNFTLVEELPSIKLGKYNFAVDIGAMNSVVRPVDFFKLIKRIEYRPLKNVKTQNAKGELVEAPLILQTSKIPFGREFFQNIPWVLQDLKLPRLSGVLGLSAFKNRVVVIRPGEGTIEIMKSLKRPANAFDLQTDFDGKIKAVEFECPESKLVMRLDSGSQVLGDILLSRFANEDDDFFCGDLYLNKSDFEATSFAGVFDRGVALNFGWPWISKFKKISISLKNGWLAFEEEGAE